MVSAQRVLAGGIADVHGERPSLLHAVPPKANGPELEPARPLELEGVSMPHAARDIFTQWLRVFKPALRRQAHILLGIAEASYKTIRWHAIRGLMRDRREIECGLSRGDRPDEPCTRGGEICGATIGIGVADKPSHDAG